MGLLDGNEFLILNKSGSTLQARLNSTAWSGITLQVRTKRLQ